MPPITIQSVPTNVSSGNVSAAVVQRRSLKSGGPRSRLKAGVRVGIRVSRTFLPKCFMPNWLVNWACAFFLLAGSSVAQASHEVAYRPTVLERLYGDIHFAYGGVAYSEIEFNPSFASFSGGAWLFPGIGFEVYSDRNLSSSREGNFELELTSTSGMAMRFQSPPRNGFFAYVLLGLAFTRIEQSESDSRGERTVIQNYEGGRISIGFGQNIRSVHGLVLVGEYRNYFVDEDLNIDAVSFGLRFDIQ